MKGYVCSAGRGNVTVPKSGTAFSAWSRSRIIDRVIGPAGYFRDPIGLGVDVESGATAGLMLVM